MAEPNTATADQPAQADAATSDATINTDTTASQPNGATTPEPSIPLSRFNQVNNELKELRKAQEKAERERQERETAEAARRGEWEKIATGHEARIKELEPQVEGLTAERDQYRDLVMAQQEAAVAALPDPLRKLCPPKEDIGGRSRFLAESADAAAALARAEQPIPRGTGPAPRPAGVAGAGVADDAARSRYAETLRRAL